MYRTTIMASKNSFEELLRDIRSTSKVFDRTCDNDMCRNGDISNLSPQWIIVCGTMRMFCCDSCRTEGTWSIRYDERKVARMLSKY